MKDSGNGSQTILTDQGEALALLADLKSMPASGVVRMITVDLETVVDSFLGNEDIDLLEEESELEMQEFTKIL